MFWTALIISLVALAADTIFGYLCLRRGRGIFALFAVITALFPLGILLIATRLHDNSSLVMSIAQWGFFVYLVTVLPRLVYYLFRLIRLPRIGIAVAILTIAGMVWSATIGRTKFVINQLEIRSERLPAAFEGFRIVQISDLHVGTMVRPQQELKRLVATVNALQPDLIVFSGDLVNIRYTELDSTVMQILSGLKAPYGVVSVLGNHDVGSYVRDTLSLPAGKNTSRLLERQQAMGWRVLNDQTEYLRRGNDSISVSGIAFDNELNDYRHAFTIPGIDLSNVYAGVSDSLFNVTVSHLPQLWDNILKTGYGDLTLAGHVHAMQVKIFGLSPAKWLYNRWSGLYEEDGRYLYINDGIGYVGFPMRMGAYPEITLFTLQR